MITAVTVMGLINIPRIKIKAGGLPFNDYKIIIQIYAIIVNCFVGWTVWCSVDFCAKNVII